MTTPNDISSGYGATKGGDSSPQDEARSKSETLDLTKADLVAFTSRLIAAGRAVESRRPDRLFNDRFAELLAGKEAMNVYEHYLEKIPMPLREVGPWSSEQYIIVDSSNVAVGSGPDQTSNGTDLRTTERSLFTKRFAVRTKYGDDFFEDCTLPPRSINQIVSLGAGMDTRGLRLRADPGTTVFEVDQALVLTVKRNILAGVTPENGGTKERLDGLGKARVIGVEVDFVQSYWANELIKAGFDPSQPSAWLLEGLTTYLDEQENVALVQAISRLCSRGSAFLATYLSAEALAFAKTTDSEYHHAWKWGSDDPKAFLEGYFPDSWSISCVPFGASGVFPEGCHYSLGYRGKDIVYAIGYSAS